MVEPVGLRSAERSPAGAAGYTGATVRLYCLPCAGGSAASFSGWSRRSTGLQIEAIEYPGRGRRWSQRPATSLESLAHDVAEEVASTASGPFALLGHSFGGLVAVEVTRLLLRSGSSLPVRLCVVATAAPHVPRQERLRDLDDAAFLEKVVSYGGVPPEVPADQELLALVLPPLRNDFRLLEEHLEQRGPHHPAPVPVPVSVYGGLQDRTVPLADLMAWSAWTSTSFRCHLYPGGHFFLDDPQLPLTDDVERDVTVSLPARSSLDARPQRTS